MNKLLKILKSLSKEDRSVLERVLSKTSKSSSKERARLGEKGNKTTKREAALPSLESGSFLNMFLFVLLSINPSNSFHKERITCFIKSIRACYDHLIVHHGITGGTRK
jgi:hypothetical protein